MKAIKIKNKREKIKEINIMTNKNKEDHKDNNNKGNNKGNHNDNHNVNNVKDNLTAKINSLINHKEIIYMTTIIVHNTRNRTISSNKNILLYNKHLI